MKTIMQMKAFGSSGSLVSELGLGCMEMSGIYGQTFAKNQDLVNKLQTLAAEKNATACQMAFAWVKSKGKNIFPLVGARTRERLNESLGTLSIQLSSEDLSKLDTWFAPGVVFGTRYPEEHMDLLNA